MNKWKELNSTEKSVCIISTMVESMDMIKYLIRKTGNDPDAFDYHVDIADHCILFYDDGFEFASGNINGFKNPAAFMSWVLLAISDYYYDEAAFMSWVLLAISEYYYDDEEDEELEEEDE